MPAPLDGPLSSLPDSQVADLLVIAAQVSLVEDPDALMGSLFGSLGPALTIMIATGGAIATAATLRTIASDVEARKNMPDNLIQLADAWDRFKANLDAEAAPRASGEEE